MKLVDANKANLLLEIKELINSSRRKVAVTINKEISILYWNIGSQIKKEIMKDTRADYGKQIVSKLAKQLTLEYGNGWSERQLWYCIKVADVFQNELILHTLCSELRRIIITFRSPRWPSWLDISFPARILVSNTNRRKVSLEHVIALQPRLAKTRETQFELSDCPAIYPSNRMVTQQPTSTNGHRLNEQEKKELVTNWHRFESLKHSSSVNTPKTRPLLI